MHCLERSPEISVREQRIRFVLLLLLSYLDNNLSEMLLPSTSSALTRTCLGASRLPFLEQHTLSY